MKTGLSHKFEKSSHQNGKKIGEETEKIFSLSENWEQGLCEWQNGPSVWHYFDAGQPVESNSLHFGRLIPDIFFIQGEQGG